MSAFPFLAPVRRAACGLLLGAAGLSLALPGTAVAQTPSKAAYWVLLRDKAGTQFDAAHYFSAPARARRLRQQLPACDSTDFPVRADYVRQISALADTVTLVSRWFNAVACRATPAQAAALRRLPGVRAVELRSAVTLQPAAVRPPAEGARMEISAANRRLARQQTASLGAAAFRQAGLAGQGLRIAIFDVGFISADKHPAFQQLFQDKRVVLTHDFVRNKADVFVGGSHGTEVLSCIAGQLPDGTPLGLAPRAEFLLARTERPWRELYAEEEAWLAAAEWADRNGADIINSSLGYTDRRYFPEQMNGRTSLVARAAELAVRKGILVVNAAGNDGDDEDWHTVGTPADGDSVLAVGGLDPDTYLHIDFSSYGPNAARRLKPNVVAFGSVLAAAPGGYSPVEGTSFASPLLAGFAACAWQQERGLTVMQLFEKIQRSADLYPYFDYAHGYGTPQARFFLPNQPAAPPAVPTFDILPRDSALAVLIRPEAALLPARTLPLYADSADVPPAAEKPAKAPALGRETPATQSQPTSPAAPAEAPTPGLPPAHPDYLYWHIADRRNVLRFYEVREVNQRAVLRIPLSRLRAGDTVRVLYRGFIQTYSAQ
ncbi:S8 family serine peptidase [Hymenobacter persicinus]|uniref:S8 family serine peptidase n=1 Tax=Hymenobacter persicinus TaxID=2025506 RepID=UPI0013E9B4A3|nr:S8 family serine peptidase [Hymenobacter persicinus]